MTAGCWLLVEAVLLVAVHAAMQHLLLLTTCAGWLPVCMP
jgi:hypothetical protein